MDHYTEKFMNFKRLLKNVAEYNPTIQKWFIDLEPLSLSDFMTGAKLSCFFDDAIYAQSKNDMPARKVFCEEILTNLAEQENFNLESIHDEDREKIVRYLELFTCILSDI